MLNRFVALMFALTFLAACGMAVIAGVIFGTLIDSPAGWKAGIVAWPATWLVLFPISRALHYMELGIRYGHDLPDPIYRDIVESICVHRK